MTARDRKMLAGVCLALIVLGFWMLVIKPKNRDGKALDAQIAFQQQRLTDARALQARARTAKAGFEADYAAVARLGQAVPADDDVPSLVY
ncbi:unannotated protein [freshwater metagenome]|uniref:Unannotated protein n=1 Tax=freshwater metagenome TaxID=449393 RepID=A0A6J7HNU4_9ZZZZ|nr:hypothetical protein [Actinomycetota bacterium]